MNQHFRVWRLTWTILKLKVKLFFFWILQEEVKPVSNERWRKLKPYFLLETIIFCCSCVHVSSFFYYTVPYHKNTCVFKHIIWLWLLAWLTVYVNLLMYLTKNKKRENNLIFLVLFKNLRGLCIEIEQVSEWAVEQSKKRKKFIAFRKFYQKDVTRWYYTPPPPPSPSFLLTIRIFLHSRAMQSASTYIHIKDLLKQIDSRHGL